MKHVNATGKAILDALARHVREPGDSYRMEREPYMPLVISRLTDTVYSLGHYGEQNGDLMADPEIEFLHGVDGEWYPFSYLNHYVGKLQVAAEFERGRVKRFNPRAQAEMAQFANMWLKNVKSQFDIGKKPASKRAKR